jgi:hypothetical protein
MKRARGLMLLAAGIGILFMICGCHGGRVIIEDGPGYTPAPPPPPPPQESGPPPWAPAHGHRAKYRYYYYPSSYVYFDVGRRLYFYNRDAGWQVSVSLPTSIYIDVSDRVELDMETDRPYHYHSDVVRKYPPGHGKKEDHGKGKGKNKG